jgi:hypothetical protein
MRIYEYDIWDGDKGIIFANNMEEAKSLFKADYPNTKVVDCCPEAGYCIIRQFYDYVPTKPELLFMYD